MTQQEELAYLRALVAKQKEQLAEQERIIEKQNRQIENMTQALLHARKKQYGSTSETTKQVEGQMCLFESTQELAKQLQQAMVPNPPLPRSISTPSLIAQIIYQKFGVPTAFVV